MAGVGITTYLAFRFILRPTIDKICISNKTARQIKFKTTFILFSTAMSVRLLAGSITSQITLVAMTVGFVYFFHKGSLFRGSISSQKIEPIARSLLTFVRTNEPDSLRSKILSHEMEWTAETIISLSDTPRTKLNNKVFDSCLSNGNQSKNFAASMAQKTLNDDDRDDFIETTFLPVYNGNKIKAWHLLCNVIALLPHERVDTLIEAIGAKKSEIFNIESITKLVCGIYKENRTEGCKLLGAILTCLDLDRQELLYEKLFTVPELSAERDLLLTYLVRHYPQESGRVLIPSLASENQTIQMTILLKEVAFISLPSQHLVKTLQVINLSKVSEFKISLDLEDNHKPEYTFEEVCQKLKSLQAINVDFKIKIENENKVIKFIRRKPISPMKRAGSTRHVKSPAKKNLFRVKTPTS